MFKPRMYKSNGLEAYHLISDEGGSFLYEGRIEYSDAELFKDDQYRAYYLVTTDIGSPSKHYVEVEPEGKPIPAAATPKEKSISDLMRTTPVDKRPETVAPAPSVEPEAAPAPEVVQEPATPPAPIDTETPHIQKETCFETPEKAAEEPKAEEPKYEPPGEKLATGDEAKAAVRAMAALGEHRPHKKSKLPLLIVLVLLALVIVGAGAVVYNPGIVSGIHLPQTSTATPTPEPTAIPTLTATPMPEPTATPAPTEASLPGGSDINKNLLMISPMINSSDPAVLGFIANNTNQTGTSYGNLSKVCDLFDAVNKKWSETNDNGVPQNVSESIRTLKGSKMDYSILMASLVEAQGMDSRVVAMYNDNTNAYIYYPEVKMASNDMDNYDAKAYLRGRYNITDPCIHNDGVVHWLCLSMNKTPGGYVDRLYALTVNSKDEITGV